MGEESVFTTQRSWKPHSAHLYTEGAASPGSSDFSTLLKDT